MSQVAHPTRRRSRLLQFSLRTLLVITTLAAIGCWWFLQPETRDEELAGKHLKLRRQVRLVKEDEATAGTPIAGVEEDVTRIISDGRWRLRGEHDDLLVAGRYGSDQPHGNWTIYHVNGRKAAQGEVFRGARTGRWRAWNEVGQLTSEVTYRAVEVPYEPQPYPQWIRGGMSGGGGYWYGFPPDQPVFTSQRNGPARAWHDNDKLQFEGSYTDDRRDGLWTFYDEQGRVMAAGEFQGDKREGPWRLLDKSSGETRIEAYFAGRPQAQHEALVARCERQLASGDVRRQAMAIEQLARLGRHGQPRLTELLSADSPHVRRLAARWLLEQESLAPEAIDRFDALTGDADEAVARLAMIAVYRERRERREALFEPLIESLGKSPDDQRRLGGLEAMYRADADRRSAILLAMARHIAAVEEADSFHAIRSEDAAAVARWTPSATEALPAVFQSKETVVRCFALHVVHHLALRGRADKVSAAGGKSYLQYEIPPELQPVIAAAARDPDKQVRETGESVGKFPGPLSNRSPIRGGGSF